MTSLTSTSSVMEGNSIDFTFSLDAPASTTTSYTWYVVLQGDAPAQFRDFEALSGVVRFAAGESEQTFTIPTRLNPANAGDRTFGLDIRDSGNQQVALSDIITLEDTEGEASFIITSDNNVDIPLVGDELTATLDAVDPQGNRNLYSYQWYDATDDTDIAGATGTRYTITDPGQVIGVRVSYTDRGGVNEVVTAELSATSVLVDPDAYTVVRNGDGTGADRLVGTPAYEIIQGGNKADIITTGGGDDIVLSGYGRDKITLSDNGAETIIYRFSSEGTDGWTAIDGADRVHNFKRGVDKLVFVDVDTDTPVDLGGFLEGIGSFNVRPNLKGNVLTGVVFQFIEGGLSDGPGTGDGIADSGRWFGIYYAEEDWVTVYNDDGSTTDEGAKFLGEDGAHYLSDGDRSRDRVLTDLSLLANYFGDEFQVIPTDGDDGDADLEVTSSGDINAVAVGDVLSVGLGTSDPDGDGDGAFSYQWKRGGGDIAGATSDSYTVTAADLGRALTVTVSYVDGGGTAEHVTSDAVDVPAAPLSADQASFIIISDGEISIPLVGDELGVILDSGDPQGAGTFSYQWFVVGGADIAGATEATYTITQADQIIAVRVSYTDGAGTDETVTTELDVASFAPIVDPDAYTLFQRESHEDKNFMTGTSADEIIQGGNKDDTINSGGGNDIIIGGYGRDEITLRDGAETIVYRFSSDGDWTAIDGGDTINNFNRITDKLVLVDIGATPINFDSFKTSSNINIGLIYNEVNHQLAGIKIVFNGEGFADGIGEGESSGNTLTINFDKNLIGTFDIISPEKLGIAITDFDEGSATYVITDNDIGLIEHITDATSLVEGSILYARVLNNDPDGNGTPTYQWKRGGVDIDGATSAAYVLTVADLGRDLTVTVSYTDGGGTDESVTTNVVNVPYTNDGQASFIISSDGDVDTPLVGDELTVNLDTADPDGDGAFSYQWYVVGGTDIAGATETSYTITNADQIIGVRVSYTDGEGFDDISTTELNVASFTPIVDPSAYSLVQDARPNRVNNNLLGTSTDELFQGGSRADRITTIGGDNIVIGGYGSDFITLPAVGAGIDTIVYRFSSDDGWTAVDGADRIFGFNRGTDKLVLVDVGATPIDYDGFTASDSKVKVRLILDTSGEQVVGITIEFNRGGFETGPILGAHSASSGILTINWQASDYISLDDTEYTGEGLSGVRFTENRGYELTDFSLLPNYFGAGFDDGLQVIEPDQLGVDII